MNLYDRSLQILSQKSGWAEGETVPLWQSEGGDAAAYLKRDGHFVHIYLTDHGRDLPDPFTIGEVEHENGPAEQFLFNHAEIYAAWVERARQYLAACRHIRAQVAGGFWQQLPDGRILQ